MILRRFWVLIPFLLAALASLATPVAAQPRTALVIGNSAYSFSPLVNPANDASDVAAALQGTGFDVTVKLDTDRAAMIEAIRGFGERLKRTKGMGLFFFAGHGVQIGGENYLVPVGDNFAGEADIVKRAVKATDVTDAMAAAGNYLNIVVLDACRDNGLGDSSTRGLSRIDSNARLFISYSTSPGSVAEDGTGRNSPYTKYFTQAIGVPDQSLEQTFKSTLKGVYQETNGRQTPWISSSFFGDFIFRSTGQQVAFAPDAATGATGASASGVQRSAMHVPPLLQQEQVQMPPSLTGIYRVDGFNPSGSSYRGMVAITQAGDNFTFKWWIGEQEFDGTGHLAGKMLVINWGADKPVVYTVGARGILDGEWADGSASEQLTLHALAADSPIEPREGAYKAVGRGASGRRYSGVVTIARDGERYLLDWKIGHDNYKGAGTLENNLLTVDWGSSTPVVYALSPDGSLKGLWAGGTGEETLTPQN